MKCDESGATGESDAIKKLTYDEIVRQQKTGDLGGHTDCFMVSGSKVLEGVGSYVVIAVGTKSFNGRIMMGSFFFVSYFIYLCGRIADFVFRCFTCSSSRRYGEYASSDEAEQPR